MAQAKNLNSIPVNGTRGKLADMVPLSTPYKIDIFPIYACNFKCSYCIHSVPSEERTGGTYVLAGQFLWRWWKSL